MGFRVQGLGILSPYNGESTGKLNGNWGNIGIQGT